MEDTIKAREDLIKFYDGKLDSYSKRICELYQTIIDLKKENAELKEQINRKTIV